MRHATFFQSLLIVIPVTRCLSLTPQPNPLKLHDPGKIQWTRDKNKDPTVFNIFLIPSQPTSSPNIHNVDSTGSSGTWDFIPALSGLQTGQYQLIAKDSSGKQLTQAPDFEIVDDQQSSPLLPPTPPPATVAGGSSPQSSQDVDPTNGAGSPIASEDPTSTEVPESISSTHDPAAGAFTSDLSSSGEDGISNTKSSDQVSTRPTTDSLGHTISSLGLMTIPSALATVNSNEILPTPVQGSSPIQSSNKSHSAAKKSKTSVIIGAVIGSIFFLLIIIGGLCFWKRSKQRARPFSFNRDLMVRQPSRPLSADATSIASSKTSLTSEAGFMNAYGAEKTSMLNERVGYGDEFQ